MNKAKSKSTNDAVGTRNWGLVMLALIQIVCSLVVILLSLINISSFGWFAALFIFGALISLITCAYAVKKNDASWLMLGLLNPFN